MIARKKKKIRSPPPESSSKGKRKATDTDKDDTPDIDPSVTKAKKAKVSRPKFVTKPSTTMIQEGMNLLNALFSTATTTTTVVTSCVYAIPRTIPTSSHQVTPNTQRLLDSLINTPPVVTTSTTSVTIPISTSSIPVTTIDYPQMVSTIVDLKARVVTLESLVYDITTTNSAQQQVIENQRAQLLVQQLQIDSLTTQIYFILKQLAAQGESSCKQDNLRAKNNDYEDPSDTQGGSEQPVASSIPSATHIGESLAQGESGAGSGDGDKGKGKKVVGDDVITEDGEGNKDEKLECLIDLDEDIFIDDWVSDDENVEIEFESDDEGMKYATHEGFEFDASFINQVNELEEGEIIGEEGENVKS
ncbi:hypothetical protein L1987_28080 [Smallanthus sonchifolius]|uniref:Uncharacterized protein n=1 Tax=Smallanthus sonchifolius TaxID=185202 RepID=A0ACB9IDJ1_9ASTR|nr:hypothetical protein L1987_28080 [Smallanthus sonchifolius]